MLELRLSLEEARLLKTELSLRVQEMDAELVRTDKHELQHALADDVRRLSAIEERLGQLLVTQAA